MNLILYGSWKEFAQCTLFICTLFFNSCTPSADQTLLRKPAVVYKTYYLKYVVPNKCNKKWHEWEILKLHPSCRRCINRFSIIISIVYLESSLRLIESFYRRLDVLWRLSVSWWADIKINKLLGVRKVDGRGGLLTL